MKKHAEEIAWLIFITVLCILYISNGALGHFLKHFFIGADVGLFVLLLDLHITKKLRKKWWRVPSIFWIFPMFPDVIHTAGYTEHPGKFLPDRILMWFLPNSNLSTPPCGA